jgi:MFS transporter, putative metabolite:H+ symporter
MALTLGISGITMSLAGYWSNRFLGGVSVFFLMALINQFFGSGSYSIIGPYMAEIWPARLRTSGMGLVYGVGNLGKFIGPAGLAVIAGSSNFVSPQATLAALITAMNYFAAWYFLGMFAALFGVETRGRTIEEIDEAMGGATPALAADKLAAP